jgi:hypothetical protein
MLGTMFSMVAMCIVVFGSPDYQDASFPKSFGILFLAWIMVSTLLITELLEQVKE